MKRSRLIVGLVSTMSIILPFSAPGMVHAEVVGPALMISEVKIRNDTAGFDEFIEFYNPGVSPISLNDYFIGYINTPTPATDQALTKAVIGDGLLTSGQSYILAKNDTDPNLAHAKKSPFSSLSDSGGLLRITDGSDAVIDQFAWTSTQSLAIAPIQFLCTTSAAACNLNKTQSFARSKDADGTYIFSNPTWVLGTPTPLSVDLLPLPTPDPEPEPSPDPTPDPGPAPDDTTDTPPSVEPPADTPDPTPVTTTLLPLQITELLPNPAAPASDSTDEYIELYNPNDQPVNLTGYKLQSGNTFSYSYTFTAGSLEAHQYKAFFVSETGDILSNSGGQARLLDGSGVVVAQTNPYDAADDGDGWAFVNGAWQWTTTPTPDAANVLTLPVLKVVTTKAATVKKAAATKTTKATTAKTTAAKVAAAKTTRPATATADRQVYEDPAVTPPSVHPGILVGVGFITLLYAAYEYRHDFFNRLHQLRRYREIRREARP